MRVAKDFKAQSCREKLRSVHLIQIEDNEITLSLRNSYGWNVTFDKTPMKVLSTDVATSMHFDSWFSACMQIKKRELEIPGYFEQLPDYPPKFRIFVSREHHTKTRPQLVVQGVCEECTFEIITPG